MPRNELLLYYITTATTTTTTTTTTTLAIWYPVNCPNYKVTDESKVGQIVLFFTNCPTNRNFNYKVLQIKTYSIMWFNINNFSSYHISASILSISISSCLYLRADLFSTVDFVLANFHQKVMFFINMLYMRMQEIF